MARLEFSDSFQQWDTTRPHTKWDNISVINDLTVSTTYGRNGKGVRISSGNREAGASTLAGVAENVAGNGSGMLEKRFSGLTETDWTIGFAFRFVEHISLLNMPIVQVINTAYVTSLLGSFYQAQCSLILVPEQRFVFHRGDYSTWPMGIIGSAYSTPIRRNVYYYLEAHFVLHASTGSVSLKIDGKTVIDVSNVNTLGGSGTYADGFRILHPKMTGWNFGVSVRDFDIDDVYVITGGSSATDVKVESHLPTGDGATHQWTPSTGANSAAMVDEAPNDEGTTYITTASAGNVDTYTFNSLSTAAGTVHGVGINAVARNIDADSVTLSATTRQGGSNFTSPYTRAISISEYGGNYLGNLVNPATSNRYTVSEVNADEFGPKRET